MDITRLDAIRARCEAATPGPWATNEKGFMIETEDRKWELFYTVSGLDQAKTDLRFAASARTDVPDLLAEIERLTADRDAWRRRAEAAEADLTNIAQEMYDDDSDRLRGDWYPCEVCTKPAWDNTNETCWACFAEAQARGGKTAFEWRGPEEDKPC